MRRKLSITRPENVGKRLILTRLALGFENQKDFYAATGLGASAYSMWETGDNFPRVEHMMRLCQEFKLTLDWLYRGDISSLPHALAVRIRNEASKKPERFADALRFIDNEITP